MSPSGSVWWTVAAQKGVGQPPYAVKWCGRWWRTLPLHEAFNEGQSIEPVVLEFVRSLPVIPYGCPTLLDRLVRTNRHFGDLPLLTADILYQREPAEGRAP